jgi:uncharacterized membrane protein
MAEIAALVEVLHIYGRMILFGGGLMLALGLAVADRQPDPAQAAAPLLTLQRWLYFPVLVLVPLLGLALAQGRGIGVMSIWMILAIGLYVAGAALWVLGARQAGHASRVGAGDPKARGRRNLFYAGALIAFALIAPMMIMQPDAPTLAAASRSSARISAHRMRAPAPPIGWLI